MGVSNRRQLTQHKPNTTNVWLHVELPNHEEFWVANEEDQGNRLPLASQEYGDILVC